MKISTLYFLFFSTFIVFSSVAIASSESHTHENKHGKSHSHGVGNLDIAVQGNSIKVTFELPMESTVGFEHAPKTAAQKEAIVQLQATLNKEALLTFTDAAKCQQTSIKASSPLFEGIQNKPDKTASSVHSDVSVDIEFSCANTKLLDRTDLRIFKQFTRLKTIRIQFAGPNGQRSGTVKSAQPFFKI
jgi:Protein of unknown function (DUF2796)